MFSINNTNNSAIGNILPGTNNIDILKIKNPRTT